MYCVIQRQTVLLYEDSFVWLDLFDASSQDHYLADFTSVKYVTPGLSSLQRK